MGCWRFIVKVRRVLQAYTVPSVENLTFHMRLLLSLCLLAAVTTGRAQIADKAQTADLTPFHDTVNHFSIGIPAGWRYSSQPGRGLIIYAMRPPADTSDRPHESYSLFVFREPNSTIDREYRIHVDGPASIGEMTVLDKGSITIHGQRWLWYTASHVNPMTSEALFLTEMKYVLLAYKGDKAYFLTCITTENQFERYRALFAKIAGTMVLEDQ